MSDSSSCGPASSVFVREDVERHQVDVRVLLQEPAQEPLVPARPAREEQHPHAVADDAQHERAGVVVGDDLAGEDGHRGREHERAGPLRREGERDDVPVLPAARGGPAPTRRRRRRGGARGRPPPPPKPRARSVDVDPWRCSGRTRTRRRRPARWRGPAARPLATAAVLTGNAERAELAPSAAGERPLGERAVVRAVGDDERAREPPRTVRRGRRAERAEQVGAAALRAPPLPRGSPRRRAAASRSKRHHSTVTRSPEPLERGARRAERAAAARAVRGSPSAPAGKFIDRDVSTSTANRPFTRAVWTSCTAGSATRNSATRQRRRAERQRSSRGGATARPGGRARRARPQRPRAARGARAPTAGHGERSARRQSL